MFQAASAFFKKLKGDRVQVGKRLEVSVDTSSVNAAAISLETVVTAIVSASGGADTRTLADGYPGQIKILFYMTDSTSCVVTPAHLYNGTQITFTDVNEGWIGVFYAGEWHTASGDAQVSAVT
jgi:hypothetical protein